MPGIDKSEKDIIDLLRKVAWERIVKFGSVKVQIRDGKPTLITIEETLVINPGTKPSPYSSISSAGCSDKQTQPLTIK